MNLNTELLRLEKASRVLDLITNLEKRQREVDYSLRNILGQIPVTRKDLLFEKKINDKALLRCYKIYSNLLHQPI